MRNWGIVGVVIATMCVAGCDKSVRRPGGRGGSGPARQSAPDASTSDGGRTNNAADTGPGRTSPDSGASNNATDAGNHNGAVPVGDPCRNAGECNGGLCISESNPLIPNTTFLDGYCTAICSASNGCPQGSTCFLQGASGVCLKSCTTHVQCRNGYECRAESPRACVPEGSPPPPPPPPPPTGSPIGGACNSNSDCRDAAAECLPDPQLPGGYCIVYGCDTATCPTASTCYQLDEAGTVFGCLPDCVTTTDCGRSQYVCAPPGACVPSCTVTGCTTGICGADGICS